MAKAKADGDVAVLDTEVREGYYHFGMIPAKGTVEFPMPVKEGGVGQRDFVKMAKVEPWQLWNNAAGLEEGLHIFVSKLRQHEGLGVRGWQFPAISEGVEASGGTISRATYPGQVAYLTEDRAREIIQSSNRHFVRFQFGVENMNDIGQKTELWDMAHGMKPEGYTDEQWAAHKRQHAVQECPKFNPRTDKLLSEFVYLVPLDGEPFESGDEKEYIRNPNKYHARMIGPVTKSFFENPPKSIAEMYPQGR